MHHHGYSFINVVAVSGRGTMVLERPATVAGFWPSTSSQVNVSKSVDESSDLTHGMSICVCWSVLYLRLTVGVNDVICGNPARALRARRKKKGLTQQVIFSIHC